MIEVAMAEEVAASILKKVVESGKGQKKKCRNETARLKKEVVTHFIT
jgi:hypothetical protein